MKRSIKSLLFLLFCVSCAVIPATGQTVVKTVDVLNAASAIKSERDTAEIRQLFTRLFQLQDKYLADPALYKGLTSLENKLREETYLDLLSNWWDALFTREDPASQDYAIRVGKQLLEKGNGVTSAYARYTYLALMRQLRFPFRNSSHIYEGIAYYSELNNRFLATNDSAKLTIVNNVLSGFYNRLGLTDKSVYYMLKSIDYLDNTPVRPLTHPSKILLGISGQVNRYSVLSSFLISANKPMEAEVYIKKAIEKFERLDSPAAFTDAPFMYLQLARCKTMLDPKNSAVFYDKAYSTAKLYRESNQFIAVFFMEKANDFLARGNTDSAVFYLKKTLRYRDSLELRINSVFGELTPSYFLGKILLQNNQATKAIVLLRPEVAQLRKNNMRKELVKEQELLASCYHAIGHNDSAFALLKEASSLEKRINVEQAEARSISYDIEKKMLADAEKIRLLAGENKANQKAKIYLYGIVALLLLLAGTLGLFYRNKNKTNQQLAKAIKELEVTQAQLIQSEKMASLGELTAGIAHEIQNPLNFVNNFSDINQELLRELKAEIRAGNYEEVNNLADDINSNEEKINHHGKRADSIVKGMLQHSRTSSGIKEPTDVNKLCDEFVRLSYQGLRAKDKSFNAEVITNFDESIGKIVVASQEIGRVVLNIVNNAFYAVHERSIQQQQGYKPTVTVSTTLAKTASGVKCAFISISDNGNGISEKNKDKIFQPFFTTKPTGQGTGLGLSLSYDIIKAHGGEIVINTTEGKGATFTITLPVSS